MNDEVGRSCPIDLVFQLQNALVVFWLVVSHAVRTIGLWREFRDRLAPVGFRAQTAAEVGSRLDAHRFARSNFHVLD